MSKAAAITAAGAIDTDVRQLATDVMSLKNLIGGARTACIAAGKNFVNEVEPGGNADLIWSEVTRVMIDAGLGDLVDYIARRSSVPHSTLKPIANYGTLWTSRANNDSIGTYI